MKKLLFLLILLCAANILSAQYVYTIKADSVKITNNCDTAELIIENHTQNVLGFLYNKGKGRTEFRKAQKLNDSTLLFGEDTLILRGATIASNGLISSENHVQWGQSVGEPGNPAALLNNREIPLNGKNVFFTGDSGTITIGSNTNSGFRLQTPDLQVGDFSSTFRSHSSFSHHQDSLTTPKLATAKNSELTIEKSSTFTEDGLTLPYSGTHEDMALATFNVLRIGSALTLGQGSPYTGTTGAFISLYLRKRSGFSGTSTFTGSSSPIGATSALQARVDISQSGLSPSNNLLANGWYCGVKPVITTSSNNVVENFIWLNAGTGQFATNGITNGYGLYVNTINSKVANRWAIYQEGINDTNFLAGKTKMPNLVIQTDTSSHKPVSVDANGNLTKMSYWPATAASALTVFSAGTSDFTATINTLTKLPDLTGAGSHSVTLPSAASHTGERILLWNINNSGNSWTFASSVTLPDGSTSNAIANQTTIELISDGSVWIKWK